MSGPWFKRFIEVRARQAGSILIILVLMVVVVQIAAWKARPVMATSLKRAKEKELKFVLKEFKRGILRFKKFNNRYPMKVEDLVSSPHPRYVRQLYADPMTGKREWGVERDKTGTQIIGVKSLSKEKSMAGVEYSRWFFDDSLEFRMAISENLGEANPKGPGGENTGQPGETAGPGEGETLPGPGQPGGAGSGSGQPGGDAATGPAGSGETDTGADTRRLEDPNEIPEDQLRGRRPAPEPGEDADDTLTY